VGSQLDVRQLAPVVEEAASDDSRFQFLRLILLENKDVITDVRVLLSAYVVSVSLCVSVLRRDDSCWVRWWNTLSTSCAATLSSTASCPPSWYVVSLSLQTDAV
jgi:hypothetical protein